MYKRQEQAEVTEPTESISFSEYNDTSRIKTSLRCVYGGKIYKCSISDEYVEVLWDGEQIVLPTLGKPTDFGMRSNGFEINRGGEIFMVPRHGSKVHAWDD